MPADAVRAGSPSLSPSPSPPCPHPFIPWLPDHCAPLRAGKSRGFGFVTFASAAEAYRAVTSEHHIDGRKCEAKFALPEGKVGSARTTRIFVARIPSSVTDTQFRQYFEQASRAGALGRGRRRPASLRCLLRRLWQPALAGLLRAVGLARAPPCPATMAYLGATAQPPASPPPASPPPGCPFCSAVWRSAGCIHAQGPLEAGPPRHRLRHLRHARERGGSHAGALFASVAQQAPLTLV